MNHDLWNCNWPADRLYFLFVRKNQKLTPKKRKLWNTIKN